MPHRWISVCRRVCQPCGTRIYISQEDVGCVCRRSWPLQAAPTVTTDERKTRLLCVCVMTANFSIRLAPFPAPAWPSQPTTRPHNRTICICIIRRGLGVGDALACPSAAYRALSSFIGPFLSVSLLGSGHFRGGWAAGSTHRG